MDSRRAKHRDQKIQEALKEKKSSIHDQFKDLKRSLSSVSYKEWEAIPEAQDFSIKKQKREKYTPVSDSLLSQKLNETAMQSSINVTDNEGLQSKIGDINEIGSVRQTMFEVKMNSVDKQIKGRSELDKEGYITQLDSV